MSSSFGIRAFAWLLAVVVVALPLVGLFEGWFAAAHWPVRSLRVDASFVHVPASRVRAVVTPLLARGFFAVDLAKVQKAVAALPWVEHVEVRKHWSDQVWIKLDEQQPFARWNQDQLINRHGGLFRVPDVAQIKSLPHLSGPEGREFDVLKFFLDARRSFAVTGRKVVSAKLSRRGAWSLQLDNRATVMIGRTRPGQRLARFIASYPSLMEGHGRQGFASVDLRYSNGYAVRWPEMTNQGGGSPQA